MILPYVFATATKLLQKDPKIQNCALHVKNFYQGLKLFGFSRQGYSGFDELLKGRRVLPVWNFFNGGRIQDFELQRGERPLSYRT